MHIVELYALQSGQKINKPKLFDICFPLSFNDSYITFAPVSKPAKNYDYWVEVLDILLPVLSSKNIRIVQLGAKDDPAFVGCVHTQGHTSIPQTFHLIKNAKLHFGTDTFASHVAGIYDIPTVTIYSTSFISNVKPYFGTKAVCFEPPERANGLNPSFAIDEGAGKQINSIRAEDIANAIFEKLNIPFKFAYKTLKRGNVFLHRLVDFVPDQVVDIRSLGIPNAIVRMDILHNEHNLYEQAKFGQVSIVTDREINFDLLEAIRPQLMDIHLEIVEDDNPNFARELRERGIKFVLFSYLPDDQLRKKKNHYYDLGLIVKKENLGRKEIKEIEDYNIGQLYYKSLKLTLGRGKYYHSIAAYERDISTPTYVPQLNSIIDSPSFWKEHESFILYGKFSDSRSARAFEKV